MQRLLLPLVLAITLPLSGCLALPAMAPAAVSAGGDLVKAGGSYSFGGATYRTFTAPLADVYEATQRTLTRLGFDKPEEEGVDERVVIRAKAIERKVRIDLQPITREMTQMRVFVRTEHLGKDPATASELVAQTGLLLVPEPVVAPRGEARRPASDCPRASR